MSASASQSKSDTTQNSSQTSVQGASGAQSPTITAGAGVNFNDPSLGLSALQVAGNAIMAALNGAASITNKSLSALGDVTNSNAQATASQTDSQSQVLAQALQAEQTLAAAQGTGGASLTSQSTNYFIFGAIGIAVLAVVALLFRSSNK